MSLVIHRMHTRLRTATPVESHRLAAWQDEFRQQDGERIAARWAGPEEWLLIRRLPVRLRWREDPADADVGRAWGDALDQAIARALERNDGNCVRYANRQAALADLVYRAALADDSRQWAWQRMGLIPQSTRSEQVLRHEDVLRHAMAELTRTPELVWPVLMRLLAGEEATACLTAALRALPLELWRRLFEASPRTAGFARTLAAARERAPAVVAGTTPGTVVEWTPSAQALLHWAAVRAWFVQRHREVVTVLLCACQGSAQGATQARLQGQLAHARRELDALAPAGGPTALAAPSPVAAKAPASNTPTAVAPAQQQQPAPAQAAPAERRLPELPQPEEWLHTRFAGALFWLSRISVSEMLNKLEDADSTLPLYLRELALALAVPPDDPVLPAFCGGELPRGDANPAIVEIAQRQAAEWERWLATAAPELPLPRLLAVCQREGRLRVEPGWIELHLPLSAVATSIRRQGLDLDPGWLPWLGCVVRIIYEAT